FALVSCDQIFVLAIIVIADIGLEMRRDVEELFEAFDAAREKVSPLQALQNWIPRTVEVNHVPQVGVIPTSKRHTRYQIFSVNKAKCPRPQELIVVIAEVKQSNARLTESINAAH